MLTTIQEDSSINLKNSLKRFVQWLLGCTYEKRRTVKQKIRQFFHFIDAPHVIINDITEPEPWSAKLGIIFGILLCVMILYYIVEYLMRRLSKAVKKMLEEPQSTVTTPKHLTPISSKEMLVDEADDPGRKKIRMNEPVNCVFIRPSPKTAVEDKNGGSQSPGGSDELVPMKKATFVDGSNSPPVLTEIKDVKTQTPKKLKTPKSKKENANEKRAAENAKKETFHVSSSLEKFPSQTDAKKFTRDAAGGELVAQANPPVFDVLKWLNEQNLKTDTNQSSRTCSSVLNQWDSTLDDFDKFMPIDTSTFKSNRSSDFSRLRTSMVEKYPMKDLNDRHLADIVIDDSPLFAESNLECSGNILINDTNSNVLFRWTEEKPETVKSINLTGSFLGWKMKFPMRRENSTTNVYSALIELPQGLHKYKIVIVRY